MAPPAIPTNATFLPSIHKFLPHDWRIEKEHAQQAAKEDNAPIDYFLWNLRISSVFPHITSSHCDWLREKLLRKLKGQLYSEFISYLRSQHGDLYQFFLLNGRQWIKQQLSVSNRQGGGGVFLLPK